MNIGKLRQRITIQRKSRDEDDSGYPIPKPDTEEWEDVATVWAAREPLRGREFFAAAAVQYEKTVRFRIRYRKGIKPGMRVLCDGVAYEIYAVLDDVHGDRTETHLMTTEVGNSGNGN